MARRTLSTKKVKVANDDSSVERVYEELKNRAISFVFRPGDRLNEVAITRQIGVSRTPLREALNRLASEDHANADDGERDGNEGAGEPRRQPNRRSAGEQHARN